MALNIKSFTQLVSDQVTFIQGAVAGLVDLTIGSLLRSVVESNSSVAQWLQQLIVILLATTRAATSTGTDLDSWMADYGFLRLSAVQATGQVTFARFTATYQAVVLIGTTVSTSDGTQSYTVIIDTTNAAYNASYNGYVIAAGISSVTVPVMANTAGSAANALAGTISAITGSIQYVDTVTNAAAFTNGADAESDADFRARFIAWVASLSKATKAAIGYAISSFQSGVTYTLTENEDRYGTAAPGYFFAVVDDGSGSPSSGFISSIYNAIDAVRGFTITFSVFPPSVVTANVTMTITTASGADHSAVAAIVTTAVQNYINKLPLGQLLPYTQLATIAYGASSFVTNVSTVLLNGTTSDLAATSQQIIRAGTISVG
jgi:uncharacterized phage protein gp47/JayE